MNISPTLILGVVIVLYLVTSIQILAEYERGVIFRLGKLLSEPKGPGVILVFRPIDRIVRISLRTIVRWETDGVPYWSADRLATDLGCHPIEFWADWYNAVP